MVHLVFKAARIVGSPEVAFGASNPSSIDRGRTRPCPEAAPRRRSLGWRKSCRLKLRLTIVVLTDNVSPVSKSFAKQIQQTRPFASPEQEAMLAIRRTAASVLAPWEKFLKAEFGLSTSLFNVLRILRGSHPTALTCGEIGKRTIARDPDVTRLVDQLIGRGLVARTRSEKDRRIVEVSITKKGLDLLQELDPHSLQMPRALMGHVSAAKLRQLATLLAEVLDGIGTYP